MEGRSFSTKSANFLRCSKPTLRVLEDRSSAASERPRYAGDVRVIAASNRDLEKSCARGPVSPGPLLRLAIIAIFIRPLARPQRRTSCRWSIFSSTVTTADSKKGGPWHYRGDPPPYFQPYWRATSRAQEHHRARHDLEDEPFLRPVYLPFSVGNP